MPHVKFILAILLESITDLLGLQWWYILHIKVTLRLVLLSIPIKRLIENHIWIWAIHISLYLLHLLLHTENRRLWHGKRRRSYTILNLLLFRVRKGESLLEHFCKCTFLWTHLRAHSHLTINAAVLNYKSWHRGARTGGKSLEWSGNRRVADLLRCLDGDWAG